MTEIDTSAEAVRQMLAAARAIDPYRAGEWYFPGAAPGKWAHVYERAGDSLVAECPEHDAAAFIAAANPAAVLALAAERDAEIQHRAYWAEKTKRRGTKETRFAIHATASPPKWQT